jgi:hypothetical protein
MVVVGEVRDEGGTDQRDVEQACDRDGNETDDERVGPLWAAVPNHQPPNDPGHE